MALLEYNLLEKRDKVAIAIKRIKEFEPPEGYYVAFSGGKDSVVVYDLVKRSGVKYDVHHHLTTVDPPELIRFMREHFGEVPLEKPAINMWKLIIHNKMPPTRLMRYCCRELKERGGVDRRIITGIRWAESLRRNKRRVMEHCMQNHKKIFVHPIIDWANEDVWEYIRVNHLPYCGLYDEGFDRLGCIMCPNKRTQGMLNDAKRWPTYKMAYLKAFDKMLTRRANEGLETKWSSAEEVMHWWIYGKDHNTLDDQFGLFE